MFLKFCQSVVRDLGSTSKNFGGPSTIARPSVKNRIQLLLGYFQGVVESYLGVLKVQNHFHRVQRKKLIENRSL